MRRTSEDEDEWTGTEAYSDSFLCEDFVPDQTRSLYLGEKLLRARHDLHLRGLHLLGLLQQSKSGADQTEEYIY